MELNYLPKLFEITYSLFPTMSISSNEALYCNGFNTMILLFKPALY
jgi:hypothetical protein